MRAAIVGIAGETLSPAERDLLRVLPPAGVILFGRNVRAAAQLGELVAALREALPADAVLMVDQEGGRVARLRPPVWPAHPACAALAPGGERAAWLQGALIGEQARACGFDVVCAPVLDVRHAGASDVVGDRAFSTDPEIVGRMAAAMAAGLLAGGVQPVGKHAPGHGRARLDSHAGLPHVAGMADADLLPFACNLDLPWWMTAHLVYDGFDPLPASISPRVIGEVIRGRLGYGGLVISDDLAMGALAGTPEARARAAWGAGCDIALYCPGEIAATRVLLEAAPWLTDAATERMRAARTRVERAWRPLDVAALSRERDRLLA